MPVVEMALDAELPGASLLRAVIIGRAISKT
jgi:hypothetical protein